MVERLAIMHVISGLRTGGAEQMLYRLAKAHSQLGAKSIIVSLETTGDFGERIEEAGIELHALGIRPGGLPSVLQLHRLRSITISLRPDIIQGWMYHGNLAASLCAISGPARAATVWNVRQSLGPSSEESRRTRWVIASGKMLSRLPAAIIFNSQQSIEQHLKIGYKNKNIIFIPNGFDTKELRRDFEKGHLLRFKHGIEPPTKVICHIGRFHPKKDHQTFVSAISIVLACRPNVRLLMAGRGVNSGSELFRETLKNDHFRRAAVLMGESSNVKGILSASDIFVSSSSWGEGFSNVLGEAMAHGLACVATDVGEARVMLQDSGEICPPRDPRALAEKIIKIIDESTEVLTQRGKSARSTIKRKFSIESVAHDYLRIYNRLKLLKSA